MRITYSQLMDKLLDFQRAASGTLSFQLQILINHFETGIEILTLEHF